MTEEIIEEIKIENIKMSDESVKTMTQNSSFHLELWKEEQKRDDGNPQDTFGNCVSVWENGTRVFEPFSIRWKEYEDCVALGLALPGFSAKGLCFHFKECMISIQSYDMKYDDKDKKFEQLFPKNNLNMSIYVGGRDDLDLRTECIGYSFKDGLVVISIKKKQNKEDIKND